MQYFEHLEDALHGIIIFFMGFFMAAMLLKD